MSSRFHGYRPKSPILGTRSPTKSSGRSTPTSRVSPSPSAALGAVHAAAGEVETMTGVDLAKKAVADQLTKPEQLERLDQYRRKVARKKAAIESQLRNAVQTQLDGVQTGLANLKKAEAMVQEIKESIDDVEQLYSQRADLSEVIRPIKDVNRKHQQLRTTTIHIHNIFNVPQAVQETNELIQTGRLLQAHRNLSELEQTRDELLMQLYQSEDAFVDKNTSLHHYFEPLTGLSDALGQQLWVILTKTTALVISEPRSVVTALRIIEREERADRLLVEMLDEKNIPHSHIPGRPKRWKEKCFDILETSISNRFEELQPQPQERLENKAWLNEHLTSIASLCYSDFQAMKEHGQQCFPPSYDILTYFVTTYHSNLVRLISDLVRMELNARDIVPLMIWIGDVRESFLETLGIDFRAVGPLIDPAIEQELQATCYKQVEANVRELVDKMLETEKDDWDSMQPPESDVNGAFYTTIGITLFQMIDQNISALSPLGMSAKTVVLKVCLETVQSFQDSYAEMVETYVQGHLQSGRREPPCFILYMIATANNCKSCSEFADQLKRRFCMELNESTLEAGLEKLFKLINETFDSIGRRCCTYLLDEVFMDLKPVLDGLCTKDAWFNNPYDLIGKVEGTLVDYNGDFSHLKPPYHAYIIVEAQNRILLNYMQALMQKRMVLKKDKEREKASKLIHDEARKISAMFLRLSHATNPKYIQVLEMFAEIIRSKQEFLPLEISSMATKHADVRARHVIALLAMRGDLNKSSVAKVMQQTTLSNDQTDGGQAVEATPSTLSKRKLEERNFFAQLNLPNPYTLYGK